MNVDGAVRAKDLKTVLGTQNDITGRLKATVSEVQLSSSYDTTGSFVPLKFYTSDTERMSISTSGIVNFAQIPTAPTAPAGTNTTQVATTAFVQAAAAAAAKPYKVYTALLTQIGSNAPVATVLENTLGGAVTWTRNSAGIFYGTLSAGVFTGNKTVKFATLGYTGISVNSTIEVENTNTSFISAITRVNGIQTDGVMSNGGTSIEIRVYN